MTYITEINHFNLNLDAFGYNICFQILFSYVRSGIYITIYSMFTNPVRVFHEIINHISYMKTLILNLKTLK